MDNFMLFSGSKINFGSIFGLIFNNFLKIFIKKFRKNFSYIFFNCSPSRDQIETRQVPPESYAPQADPRKLLATGITLAAAITLIAGGLISANSPTIYYCQDRDLVMNCTRLSLTHKTCYYLTDDSGQPIERGKRCTTKWIPFDQAIDRLPKNSTAPKWQSASFPPAEYISSLPISIRANNCIYSCTGSSPYDLCYCLRKKRVAYFGELSS